MRSSSGGPGRGPGRRTRRARALQRREAWNLPDVIGESYRLSSRPEANFVSFAWWLRRPSNERDWQPDVARLATAEIRGEQVTVRNVRNFRYRSATDFDERWEERRLDLG